MKNKKILVTGGAGFIGSHLVEKLVKLGAEVTILDNLSTGLKTNIEKVKHAVNFIQGDIKILKDCLEAATNKDLIFHLAAHVSVQESVKNPQECYETNVMGTLNMLRAAHESKVKTFLFSSSAAVYGPKNEPCHEESSCSPESPYGHSKLMGEILCKDFSKLHKLNTICLRYFNVFGDRQSISGSYTAVVASFKSCMQQNKPIIIFGDGLQTRDFISVDKVVEANINLASKGDKCAGQAFNIASGKNITLLELIDTLKRSFPDYKQEPIFKPARIGDIKHSIADCRRFQNLI